MRSEARLIILLPTLVLASPSQPSSLWLMLRPVQQEWVGVCSQFSGLIWSLKNQWSGAEGSVNMVHLRLNN